MTADIHYLPPHPASSHGNCPPYQLDQPADGWGAARGLTLAVLFMLPVWAAAGVLLMWVL